MSLINLRHLSAPLRSKFQIGAIVILGLLVLMIRWSSGSHFHAPKTSRAEAEKETQQKNVIIELLQEAGEDSRGIKESDADPFLDDLVSGNFDRRTRSKSVQDSSNEQGAFRDIRKSLGLQ